jgi:hypothetical protein
MLNVRNGHIVFHFYMYMSYMNIPCRKVGNLMVFPLALSCISNTNFISHSIMISRWRLRKNNWEDFLCVVTCLVLIKIKYYLQILSHINRNQNNVIAQKNHLLPPKTQLSIKGIPNLMKNLPPTLPGCGILKFVKNYMKQIPTYIFSLLFPVMLL